MEGRKGRRKRVKRRGVEDKVCEMKKLSGWWGERGGEGRRREEGRGGERWEWSRRRRKDNGAGEEK